MSRLVAAMLALALLSSAGARAAESYRFSSRTEGAYPRTVEGRAIVDDGRWRLDFDASPDEVAVFNAIVGTSDGKLLAVDHGQRTWFTLSSRARLGIDSALFSWGLAAKASSLNVKATPLAGDGGPAWRIDFSYRITIPVSGQSIRGRVRGSILIWTTPEARTLPWRPLEIHSGFDSVDQAIAAAARDIRGTIRQTETEVSRQLEDGPVLKSAIVRSVGDFSAVTVDETTFSIPDGYVFREPVLGVPALGATPPH